MVWGLKNAQSLHISRRGSEFQQNATNTSILISTPPATWGTSKHTHQLYILVKETNPTALLLQLVPNQLTAKIKATLANQKGKKIKKNQNSIPQITDHETISAQKNKKEDQKNNSTTIPLILKPKGTDWKEIISSQQSFQLEKKKNQAIILSFQSITKI